jgi:hypothetical protein
MRASQRERSYMGDLHVVLIARYGFVDHQWEIAFPLINITSRWYLYNLTTACSNRISRALGMELCRRQCFELGLRYHVDCQASSPILFVMLRWVTTYLPKEEISHFPSIAFQPQHRETGPLNIDSPKQASGKRNSVPEIFAIKIPPRAYTSLG